MVSKIILDANIILDIILLRSGDIDELKKIYNAIVEGKFKAYATTSIIHICTYWLKRAKNIEAAKTAILAMLNDIKIIDARHDMIVNALQSDMLDIEDALQYYVALDHHLDCFISRDKKFNKAAKPQLPVYDPATFIKKFMN
jgi:predicted nucleic acid-binding protein